MIINSFNGSTVRLASRWVQGKRMAHPFDNIILFVFIEKHGIFSFGLFHGYPRPRPPPPP